MTDDPLDGDIETALEAPRWMRLDEEAATVWNAVYPALHRVNFIRRQDLAVLARYCKHVVRWTKLDAAVNKAGETYLTESKHGKLQRINPDLNALLRVEKAMLDIEDRFGLSPASRYRIMTMKANTGVQGDLPLGDTQKPAEPQADDGDRNVVTFPGIGSVPVRSTRG